jgi:NAD(P)-dependent dehydrogenase (short-subunit alcohol dehydrogenase family)
MDIATLFDIKGKRALVTGGTAGIGAMIAEGLVNAGAIVTVCSRKANAVAETVERLSAFGTIDGIAADLSTQDGIDALTAHVNAAGPLHILVNNAGVTWGAPIDEFPRAGFEKVLNMNLLSPFMVTKGLLPSLRQAGIAEDPARIVNIASIDGYRVPDWESYPYSASKAGIIHMGRHLGKFLAGDHISVNTIAPGLFPSRMSASVFDFDDPDAGSGMTRIGGPGRVGRPEDIVGGIIYLCSRAGAWMSGTTLSIGGGVGTID